MDLPAACKARSLDSGSTAWLQRSSLELAWLIVVGWLVWTTSWSGSLHDITSKVKRKQHSLSLFIQSFTVACLCELLLEVNWWWCANGHAHAHRHLYAIHFCSTCHRLRCSRVMRCCISAKFSLRLLCHNSSCVYVWWLVGLPVAMHERRRVNGRIVSQELHWGLVFRIVTLFKMK